MKEQIKKCQEEYVSLGYAIQSGHSDFKVMNRAALWSALSNEGKFADTVIGDAFGYDRTTILYHRNRHEENMKFMLGYNRAYILAASIVKKRILNHQLSTLVDNIDNQIKELHQLKSNLIKTLS